MKQYFKTVVILCVSLIFLLTMVTSLPLYGTCVSTVHQTIQKDFSLCYMFGVF
jgi:hypothetical protein